jgi:hypothetical protein
LYFLGCDPDLHILSIAVVRTDGKKPELDAIYLTKTKGSKGEAAVLDILSKPLFEGSKPVLFFGDCAVAVESQDVSYTGRTNSARVSDLVSLAQVAGGVCSRLMVLAPRTMLLVKPQAWKGSQPKRINQCRTMRKLGLEYTMMGGLDPYPVPLGIDHLVHGDKLNKGDWKDINDSIGLALHALDRWELKGEL